MTRLLLLTRILRLPFLLPILAAKLVVFAYTTFLKLTMGITTSDRTESEKNPGGLEKHSAAVEIEAACPICQETVGSRSPDGKVEGWSVLPCGHHFGSYCIKHYLGMVADDRPLCPICREAAHHQCGHPVLPVMLGPEGANPDAKKRPSVRTRAIKVQQLQSSPCEYCRPFPASERRPGKRRSLMWMTPCRWLRRLVPFRQRNRTGGRDGSDRNTYRVRRTPRHHGDGPWTDSYPRAPDPEWQRWWRSQAPRGA
ncbi:hypothetical protein VTK56DRAFT_117 [Thermocarpiscus australiensis]